MGVVAFYFSSVRLCAGQVRCGYSKPHRLTARPQPEYPSTSGYFEFELYTYTYVIVYVYVCIARTWPLFGGHPETSMMLGKVICRHAKQDLLRGV